MSRGRQASNEGSGSSNRLYLSRSPLQHVVYVPATSYSEDCRTKPTRVTFATTKQEEENKPESKNLKDEIANMKATVMALEADRDGLARKVKEAVQKEANLLAKIDQLKGQRDDYQRTNQTLLVAKGKLETDLSASKNRLSRVMGVKLADNNPDIADLSDTDRPTKLAEKYTELYDNQWTDAFEIVSETSDERQGVAVLLDLLWDVREFCATKAHVQIDELTRAILMTDSEKPVSRLLKQLKDLRKATAKSVTGNVLKLYETDLRVRKDPKLWTIQHAKVQSFVKECMELCWLMAVQDPPLVLGQRKTANTVETFDTSIYKPYTVTGAYLEFLVWPPLYLHENGPLLAKGVAQGMKLPKKISAKVSAQLKVGPGSAVTVPVTDPRSKDASRVMLRSYHSTKSNQSDFSKTVTGSSIKSYNFQL